MNINAFIPFILGLFTLSSGAYILIKVKRSYLSRPYFISSLVISFYLFMHFGLIQFYGNELIFLPWLKVCLGAMSFIAPALINLLLSMRRVKTGLIKVMLFISSMLSVLVFYFLSHDYKLDVNSFAWGSTLSVNSFAYLLFFINIVLFLPLAVVMFLVQKSSIDTSILAKRQIKFIVLCVCVICLALGVNFLAGFGLNVYLFGSPLLCVTFICMSYTITRYRSLELDLIVNNTILLLMFVGPLLVLHILISAFFLEMLGYLFATTFSLLLVVSLVLFTPYKKLVKKLMERLIYRGKYNYQKVLSELCQGLNAVLDFDQLFDRIIYIIGQTLDVEEMAIFLKDDTANAFCLKASYGIDQDAHKDFTLSIDEPIVVRMKKEAKILLKEELRQFEDIENVEQEFKKVSILQAELVAPLFFREHLLGFIVLSRKKTGNIYNQGDIDVLNTFAVEAAKAIEHVRLYSEAIVDNTTKVFNQNYFLMRLREEIARSKRYGHSISLMFLDVDTSGEAQFKVDSRMQELLLKGLGLLLKSKVRNVDILALYKKQQFAVILPETAQAKEGNEQEKFKQHYKDTMLVAERLCKSVEDFKNEYKGKIITVSFNMGVACFDGVYKLLTEEAFIDRAQKALAQAREEGNNKIVCFNEVK
ncbi:MAG: diguanylate cyclase [Candidatus Omnitrophica bacterium]|nr:diguanylate cyclase [Candidatus Omnitrophota bacterium]